MTRALADLPEAYLAVRGGEVERAVAALEGVEIAADLRWLTRAHIALATGADMPAAPAALSGRAAVSAARWSTCLWGSAWTASFELDGHARQLFDGWRALASGQAPPALDALDGAKEHYRRSGAPELLLDATVLLSLLHGEAGDVPMALRHARTATRMARTEAMPQLEYVAGITLARARRMSGSPAHAILILRAVRKVAPRAYRPWIDWEMAVADGAAEAEESAPAVALRAGGASSLAGVPAFAMRDAGAIRRLLRLEDGAASERRVYGPGLGTIALLLRPGHAARNVSEHALVGMNVPWPCKKETGKRRAAKLVAALADGGEQEEATSFAAVYGFRMVRDLHAGTFDVMLHRTRRQLEGLARLERNEGTLQMVVDAPFAVADPRAASKSRDRILHAIAGGATSAAAAAKETGLSLRQAQDVLRELAESGECRAKKVGRKMHYRLEDTVFHTPTRTDWAL
ncbi:MAG: hypothetical protein AAF411_01200 [Myxococcota bacterium]